MEQSPNESKVSQTEIAKSKKSSGSSAIKLEQRRERYSKKLEKYRNRLLSKREQLRIQTDACQRITQFSLSNDDPLLSQSSSKNPFSKKSNGEYLFLFCFVNEEYFGISNIW